MKEREREKTTELTRVIMRQTMITYKTSKVAYPNTIFAFMLSYDTWRGRLSKVGARACATGSLRGQTQVGTFDHSCSFHTDMHDEGKLENGGEMARFFGWLVFFSSTVLREERTVPMSRTVSHALTDG